MTVGQEVAEPLGTSENSTRDEAVPPGFSKTMGIVVWPMGRPPRYPLGVLLAGTIWLPEAFRPATPGYPPRTQSVRLAFSKMIRRPPFPSPTPTSPSLIESCWNAQRGPDTVLVDGDGDGAGAGVGVKVGRGGAVDRGDSGRGGRAPALGFCPHAAIVTLLSRAAAHPSHTGSPNGVVLRGGPALHIYSGQTTNSFESFRRSGPTAPFPREAARGVPSTSGSIGARCRRRPVSPSEAKSRAVPDPEPEPTRSGHRGRRLLIREGGTASAAKELALARDHRDPAPPVTESKSRLRLTCPAGRSECRVCNSGASQLGDETGPRAPFGSLPQSAVARGRARCSPACTGWVGSPRSDPSGAAQIRVLPRFPSLGWGRRLSELPAGSGPGSIGDLTHAQAHL